MDSRGWRRAAPPCSCMPSLSGEDVLPVGAAGVGQPHYRDSIKLGRRPFAALKAGGSAEACPTKL